MRLTIELIRTLPLILLLALSAGLYMPEAARGQVSVSFQAGASLTTAAGRFGYVEDALGGDDPEFQLSFAARASAIIPLNAGAALQIGVAYTGKGMSYWIDNPIRFTEEQVDWIQRVNYVEFPLLLNYKPFPKRTVTPHVVVSSAISLTVDCNVVSKTGDSTIAGGCKPDASIPYISKSVDVGLVAGLG